MRIGFAVVVLLCLSFGAAANASELSLGQAIQQGLEFSPELKKAKSALAEIEARTQQARRRLLPTIDGVVSSDWGTFDEFNAALQANQPLYRGGLLSSGIKSFEKSIEIERQRTFSVQQKAVADLVRAYYRLSETERELRAADDQIGVLKNYTAIVTRYEQLGRSRKMDRLQARVNLTLTEADRSRLEKERTSAIAVLGRLLGNDSKTVQVSLKIANPAVSVPSEPDSMARAEKYNPEYRMAFIEREKQEADNQIDLAEDLPQLDLVGSYGYREVERFNAAGNNSDYYTFGLALRVPLFSGLSSMAKRRSHESSLRQADQQIVQAQVSLRESIQRALIAVNTEAERVKTAQQALEYGREALALADSAYRQGVATNQDVLNAQRSRYDAERAYIAAEYAYLNSILDLKLLMGEDLIQVYGK